MTEVPRRSSTIQGMKGKIMLIWKGGVLLSSRIPSIGFFGSGVGLAVGAIVDEWGCCGPPSSRAPLQAPAERSWRHAKQVITPRYRSPSPAPPPASLAAI